MTTLCCRLGTHRTQTGMVTGPYDDDPLFNRLAVVSACHHNCLENRFGRRTILATWRHVQILRRECRPCSLRAGFLPRQRHKEAAFHSPIFGEVCLTGGRERLLHILPQGCWPIVRHDSIFGYIPLRCGDATRH